MLALKLLVSLSVSWATGTGSASADRDAYLEQLFADYADFAPRRAPVHHPRELGPAAPMLYVQLHRTFRWQDPADRRRVLRFFGRMAALGFRHDLDSVPADAVENAYRRDLRQLMIASEDVAIPHVVRMLVTFARRRDFAHFPDLPEAARDALVPVIDELASRAGRADLPAERLVDAANVLGYVGTDHARAAAKASKVAVLRPICDPLFR